MRTLRGPRLPENDTKKTLYTAVGIVFFLAACVFLVFTLFQKIFYPIKYDDVVEKWALEYEVDPMLVYAVIHTESGFDPMAESSAGARGLMQMTEETFHYLTNEIAPDEELNFNHLYEPEVAIRLGTYYLSLCMQRYGGDRTTALAAYHSGWGTVDRLLQQKEYSADDLTLQQSPYKQMNHYINKVEKAYQHYQEIYT